MAESAYSIPRGAEISERSSELVLPERDGEEPKVEALQPDLRALMAHAQAEHRATASDHLNEHPAKTRTPEAQAARGEIHLHESGTTTESTVQPAAPQHTRTDSGGPESAKSVESNRNADASQDARDLAGRPLPGDRGPRINESNAAHSTHSPSSSSGSRTDRQTQPSRKSQESPQETQRPSFWRRIALGRRLSSFGASSNQTKAAASAASRSASEAIRPGTQPAPANDETSEAASDTPAVRTGLLRTRATTPALPNDTAALEGRIVEPLLQALVSVEAKLERSHTELVGRSDKVDQRLTQLWDIEEQLGTLGELQDSLLQVSEQQRRLETAIVSQTRTIRWLVGAVFVCLAGAAFVVAAVGTSAIQP